MASAPLQAAVDAQNCALRCCKQIKTRALDSFPDDADVNKSDLYQTPAGKPLEGKDVSNLVNFLISDESNMIRGQNIIIDGGRSLVI